MTTQPDGAPPDDSYPASWVPVSLRPKPQADPAPATGPLAETTADYPGTWLPRTMKED